MSVQLREKELIPISFQAIESIKAIPAANGQKILAASRDKAAYIFNFFFDF